MSDSMSAPDRNYPLYESSPPEVDLIADRTPYIGKNVNRFLKLVVLTTGILTILIGLLALTGWIFGVNILTTMQPSYISIKVNTSLSFVLLGASLLFSEIFPERKDLKVISRVLVIIVVCISLLTIIEYIFNFNAGIDQLFFKDASLNNVTKFPGRMAFNTSICFLLLGAALIFIDTNIKSLIYFAQILPLTTVLLSLLPLLGYLYGTGSLLTVAFFTPMALYTAITLLLLSLGIICLPRSEGFLTILSVNGPGGYMARRLLPISIIIPVIFVWLRLLTKTEESESGTANVLIISFLYIGILVFFIWKIAKSVNSMDMERLLSQKALKQSEQRFYHAFHSSPAALVITRMADGLILDLNESYCDLVGIPVRDLLGKSTIGIDLWVDSASRDKMIAELTDKGKVQNLEISLHKGAVEIRSALASFELIELNGEKCIISSAIDITERKQAEDIIKTSEARFHSTLDNMMEGCQLLSHDWTYLYINDAAEKQYHRPSSELIGKTYLNAWPGIENTEYYIRLKKCMDNQVASVMENEFSFLNGDKGWFDLRIQPVPEGIFILSTEVTDRVLSSTHNMLANEILEHLNKYTDSGEMITSVIDSIKLKTGIEAVGIRIKEGEDYPYFRTAGFSEDFVNAERYLCSYDKTGNIERDKNHNPLLECMCGNILCNRVDSSKTFFTSGGSFRSNNTTLLLRTTSDEDRLARTRNRCNSVGYESVALIPLRSGNEIIGLLQLNDHRPNIFDEKIIPFFERLGSSIGIAIMRNKAENEIKNINVELERRVKERTEQLLDSNKELESFAYSVSHDLRAPLRHVIGFTEILESEIGDKHDPDIKILTDKIKKSARRMNKLIDVLLTYSRLGRTDIKTGTLQLNPIIRNLIAEATELTKDRNIEWKINKLPDAKADPTLIRLVLQNLIYNAIKFTGNKENTVIEIGCIEQEGQDNTYYVKDNGTGFSMKYADKLFGVFQRLHSNEEFEGTGIGLAIVKRVIKRHNGSVWAEAAVNEGATFYFTLPG